MTLKCPILPLPWVIVLLVVLQPAAPTIHFTSSPASATMPFEFVDNGILIKARVNDSDPTWFVFDSGASVTVVNERLASELGLKGRSVTGEALGGATAGFAAGDVTIGLPGLEALHQAAMAVPLDEMSAYAGRQIGGIIGNTFIAGCVATIDYAHHTLTLTDRKVHNLAGVPEALLLQERDGVPAVRLAVSLPGRESISDWFTVDTGSDRALQVNKPFADAHQLLETVHRSRTTTSLGAGLGGQTRFTMARVDTIQLGVYTIQRPVVSISEDSTGIGASQQPGILGGEILSRFTVVLDYQAGRMLLTPNDQFKRPFDVDMSGLQLITALEDFRVIRILHVIPHSAAAVAGLQDGDVLQTVDGRQAGDLGLDRLMTMFQQDGKQYAITAKRGDKVLTARLKLKRLV